MKNRIYQYLGCLLFLVVLNPFSQAQKIIIQSGKSIIVQGNNTITVEGSWENNGTFVPGSGTVILDGGAVQDIINPTGNFHNLIIDRGGPFDNATLQTDITVENDLSVIEGNLELNGFIANLMPNATLVETITPLYHNTVIGATGKLTTTRNLNAPSTENIAGMGFEITSAVDLGSTIIDRGHGPQTGNGQSSIFRYYEVTPSNNTGLNATVVFNYFNHETNGQPEHEFKLFRSEDAGVNWTQVPATVDALNNKLTATGVQSMSRWTVSANCMETLVATNAVCQDITVNLDGTGNYTLIADELDAGSTGACGINSKALDVYNLDCSMIGVAQMITLTITGEDGAVSTCMANVTPQDVLAPVMNCLNPTLSVDANGELSIQATDLDGGSADNCGIDSLWVDFPTLECNAVGSTTSVTLFARDADGNNSSCDATVTIADAVFPTALCRNTTRALSKSGRYKPKVAHVNDGSFDNCGIASIAVSPPVFLCADLGDVDVTLTVIDDAGNESTCIGVITLIDNFTPKIRCPQNITIDADPVNCTAIVDYEVLFADNCDAAVLSQLEGLASGEAFPIGTTNNIYEVVDGVGLSKQCGFTVTVNDPGGCSPSAPVYDGSTGITNANFQSLNAYPNPFTHDLIIEYKIEQASTVQLSIYDLKSRSIAQLEAGFKNAGQHSVRWGADQALAAGTYLICLQTDAGVETKQVVFVK